MKAEVPRVRGWGNGPGFVLREESGCQGTGAQEAAHIPSPPPKEHSGGQDTDSASSHCQGHQAGAGSSG